MTRDDVIRMAREAGFNPYDQEWIDNAMYGVLSKFAELVAAKETEARKAAQLETIALREELTKRAMQAEKEAYQRGVRDEREACARVVEAERIGFAHDDEQLNRISAAIRSRNNKDNQQ